MSRPVLRARLAAVASYLPEGQLTNEMLVREFPDWTSAKISDKTGIHSRHMAAVGEFTSDIAVLAGEKLFAEHPELKRSDIDFLVLMTLSPDYIIPFTAGMIQARLGLRNDCGAMDSTLGCSGYVYGLGLAAALVESGRARRILLITADKFTPYTEEGDRAVKALFGDGGACTLIEAATEAQVGETGRGGLIGAVEFGTDGTGALNLVARTSCMRGFAGDQKVAQSKPTLEMSGPDIFNFTLGTISKHVKGFLEANKLAIEDVDLFVFHQANEFMLQHLRKRLGIAEERFAIHLASVGNTLSSTIPLALEAAIKDGRVRPGSRVVLTGFGVGYSWGSVLVEYPG
jgi:3-oxoacyl-[acyl-carrier-protein] synthase III